MASGREVVGARHDGPRRRICQRLEGQGATKNGLGVPALVVTQRGPLLPVADRLGEAPQGFRLIQRLGLMGGLGLIAHVGGQHMPLFQNPLRPEAVFDLLHGGGAVDPEGVGAAVGEPRMRVFQVRVGDDGAVVEAGVALERETHAAADALQDTGHPQVGASFVVLRRPRWGMGGHEIRKRRQPCARPEGGLQHVGGRQVASGDGPHLLGSYAEVAACLGVQNAVENAGAVEAWKAAPVDGAVQAHQGGGMAVADQAVVADGLVIPIQWGRSHGLTSPAWPSSWAAQALSQARPSWASSSSAASGPQDPGW